MNLTVAELIEKLQALPDQKQIVVFWDNERHEELKLQEIVNYPNDDAVCINLGV